MSGTKPRAKYGPLYAGAPEHPKTYELAERLGIPRAHAFGLMAGLWANALSMTVNGQMPGRARQLAMLSGWEGDPEVLAAAFLETHLLDVDAAGRWWVHDFADYGGKSQETVSQLVANFKGAGGAREKGAKRKDQESEGGSAATADGNSRPQLPTATAAGNSRRQQPPATAVGSCLSSPLLSSDLSFAGKEGVQGEGNREPERQPDVVLVLDPRPPPRDPPSKPLPPRTPPPDPPPDVVVEYEPGQAPRAPRGILRGARSRGVVGLVEQSIEPRSVADVFAWRRGDRTLGEELRERFPAFDGKADRRPLQDVVMLWFAAWSEKPRGDRPAWPHLAIARLEQWLAEDHQTARRSLEAELRKQPAAAEPTGRSLAERTRERLESQRRQQEHAQQDDADTADAAIQGLRAKTGGGASTSPSPRRPRMEARA